jgi:hypothetical protein
MVMVVKQEAVFALDEDRQDGRDRQVAGQSPRRMRLLASGTLM